MRSSSLLSLGRGIANLLRLFEMLLRQFDVGKTKTSRCRTGEGKNRTAPQTRRREGENQKRRVYTWKELPQPQVDFTCGLLNLKPDPSRVST